MKKHQNQGKDDQSAQRKLKPRTPYDLGERAAPVSGRSLASRREAPSQRTETDDEETRQKRAFWDKLLAEEEQKEQEADDDMDEYEDDDTDADEDDDDNIEDAPARPTDDDLAPKSRVRTNADLFPAYLERLKERRSNIRERNMAGEATGLSKLDHATEGIQQITVIGGRAQTGKTSLAAQMCLAALRANPDLAVAYLLMDDMPQDELFDQLVCYEARIDRDKYLKGQLSAGEQKEVDAAINRLGEEVQPRMTTFTRFSNEHGRGLSGQAIFKTCHEFMEQVGAKRVLVVLDMFNDLPHPKATGAWDEDVLPTIRRIESDLDRWRLEQVLELRRLSERVCPGGWPVLALCELRKPTSQREEEPSVDDLLGGVELSYKAKRIFFLVPDSKADAGKPTVPMTLVVKKARHARLSRVPLLFHHTQFRFEEANVIDASSATARVASVPPTKRKRFAGK